MNYVKPELLVVAVVLYFVGVFLKQAETVADKYIYVFATSTVTGGQEVAMAIFTAITQGILVAGLSTYVNQVIKQVSKEE